MIGRPAAAVLSTIALVMACGPAAAQSRTEREKRAIEAWEKEEQARQAGSPPLGIVPPPARRANSLPLPPYGSGLPMPKTDDEPEASGLRRPNGLPVPPLERAAPATPAVAVKPVPPPPSAPPVVQVPPPVAPVQPAAVESPKVQEVPVAPPAARVEPAAAAAPVLDPLLPPPSDPVATTVLFTARSSELSDMARIALGYFAGEANAQRLRQIELRAYVGGDDPVESRKLALARTLAVHAFLIDLGVRARIEIGGVSQATDMSSDRVEVLTPKF